MMLPLHNDGELMPIVTIELKDGDNLYQVIGTVERVPRQHGGWQSVRWQGRRYQLFGGIRNPLFINVKHPLKGKGKV